ncbi:MAG: hypothetical protein GY927_01030 [bacterium]|nr:hypothetical protein [bacterium]
METFCIRVEGHLDKTWSEWLGEMEMTYLPDGSTTLVGSLPDQAALFGLLIKLRDLGVSLLDVKRLNDRSSRTTKI